MLYTWNEHTIVNQLYFNKKKKKEFPELGIQAFTKVFLVLSSVIYVWEERERAYNMRWQLLCELMLSAS